MGWFLSVLLQIVQIKCWDIKAFRLEVSRNKTETDLNLPKMGNKKTPLKQLIPFGQLYEPVSSVWLGYLKVSETVRKELED